MKAEDLIQKCIQGNAPKSLIKELEEELPNIQSIRLELLSQLNAIEGTVLVEIKHLGVIKVIVEVKSKRDASDIVDVYSSVYPEYQIYVKTI